MKPSKVTTGNVVRYLSKTEEKRLRDALAKREATRRAHRKSGNAWCKERGGDGRPLWPANGFTDHLMPMVLVAMNTGLRRGGAVRPSMGGREPGREGADRNCCDGEVAEDPPHSHEF